MPSRRLTLGTESMMIALLRTSGVLLPKIETFAPGHGDDCYRHSEFRYCDLITPNEAVSNQYRYSVLCRLRDFKLKFAGKPHELEGIAHTLPSPHFLHVVSAVLPAVILKLFMFVFGCPSIASYLSLTMLRVSSCRTDSQFMERVDNFDTLTSYRPGSCDTNCLPSCMSVNGAPNDHEDCPHSTERHGRARVTRT